MFWSYSLTANKRLRLKIRDMKAERKTHLVQEKVLVNLGEHKKSDMLRHRISDNPQEGKTTPVAGLHKEGGGRVLSARRRVSPPPRDWEGAGERYFYRPPRSARILKIKAHGAIHKDGVNMTEKKDTKYFERIGLEYDENAELNGEYLRHSACPCQYRAL